MSGLGLMEAWKPAALSNCSKVFVCFGSDFHPPSLPNCMRGRSTFKGASFSSLVPLKVPPKFVESHLCSQPGGPRDFLRGARAGDLRPSAGVVPGQEDGDGTSPDPTDCSGGRVDEMTTT